MVESYTVSFDGEHEVKFDKIEKEQFMNSTNMDSEEELYELVEQRVKEQLSSMFKTGEIDELTVTVSGG